MHNDNYALIIAKTMMLINNKMHMLQPTGKHTQNENLNDHSVIKIM